MRPLINKTGITIKELKNLIKDLPEIGEYGNDYELWIEHTEDSNISTPARSIFKLNQGDLIISIE